MSGFRPGDAIGPYTIEHLLGKGGMGAVYLATAPSGEKVAVKIVRSELGGDEMYRKRFEREANAAGRVQHPNVVQVIASGDHEGVPYLVQRFVVGGSLEDRIGRDGPQPLDVVLTVAEDVAAGLEALHADDLVHRDIKPGNILFGDDGHAQITDFGLAKDWAASLLTRPGQAVGSLDYMAPEQIRGQDVDARTDIYALGCVVVECLTGKPPYSTHRGIKIMFAHLQEEPPDPTAHRDDVPPGFGAAVLKALEKAADDRPQTPSEYAGLLRSAAVRAG